MPSTAYTQRVAQLPGLLGHWDLGSSGMPVFSGTLPALTAGTTPGTFAQSSIIPGDPTNSSVVRAAASRTSETGRITNRAALDITRCTLGCWVRVDSVYDDAGVVQRGDKYSLSFKVTTYGTLLARSIINVGALGLVADSHDWMIAPGNPVLLTTRFDGTTRKLSINGIVDASVAVAGSLATGSDDFVVGSSLFGTPVNGFVGAMQGLFLCSQAASDQDIRDIYVLGSASSTAPEIANRLIYAMPWSRVAIPAASRNWAELSNSGDAPVWVSKGPTAASGQGIHLQPFGGRIHIAGYTGDISVISQAYMGGRAVGLEVG